MECDWIKNSASLEKGVVVINKLDGTKFEQFLRRIVSRIKLQDTEIFTEEEIQKLEKILKIDNENLQLAIKTVLYLFKKMLKFVFKPQNLKNDLNKIGMSDNKADVFVKLWSMETRIILNELVSDSIEQFEDSDNFSWKLNAELSSEYRKKCKTPKTYLSLGGSRDETAIELTHPELYSVFLQFESIQNELDNLMNI